MSQDTSPADLPSLPEPFQQAIKLIDEAHAGDPNLIDGPDGSKTLPYELHYARKMTRWLAMHTPDAPAVLQVACRAQHFRRYVPCGSPMRGVLVFAPIISNWLRTLLTRAYLVDGNFLEVASQ